MKKLRYLIPLLHVLCACSSVRFANLTKEPMVNADSRDTISSTESIGSHLKRKISILAFWNDAIVTIPELESFSAKELENAINQNSKLVIAIPSEEQTQNFVQNNFIKVEQLVRTARMLGVNAIAIGKITAIRFQKKNQDVGILSQAQLYCEAELDIKIFDATNSKEILSMSKTGQSFKTLYSKETEQEQEFNLMKNDVAKNAIQNALTQVVKPIVDAVSKLSWQGSIAKIISPNIYINSGKASGLTSGDILKVLTTGEDIYDPITGACLGRSPGRMKGTLEVIDFIGENAAQTRAHSGGNFQVGDMVELY